MKHLLSFGTAMLAVAAAPSLAAREQAANTAPAAAATSPAAVTYGTFGLDLDARDPAVKPGEDFQRHATGAWLARTTIPADKAGISAGQEIHDRTEEDLRALVAGAGQRTAYGRLYTAFMDEARVEAVGDAPLRADIAQVDGIRSHADFARHMGRTFGTFGSSVVAIGVDADTADPTVNVLWLGQGGLGLPDRDYYLDPQFKPQRDAVGSPGTELEFAL